MDSWNKSTNPRGKHHNNNATYDDDEDDDDDNDNNDDNRPSALTIPALNPLHSSIYTQQRVVWTDTITGHDLTTIDTDATVGVAHSSDDARYPTGSVVVIRPSDEIPERPVILPRYPQETRITYSEHHINRHRQLP
jgi:hypothetical protein